MNAQRTYPWEAPATGPAAELAAGLQAMLPRLETERLVCRAPAIDDFAVYRVIMMSDRAVHMGGPLDRRDAWLDFTQCIANWPVRGHGLFTIAAKDTGQTLGFTLICMEHGDREPELGWFLAAAQEGRGYAFEAAAAVRDWGIETLRLPTLVSYIDPPNTRSIRLAERLDAWHDTRASAEISDAQAGEVLVYRHWPHPGPQSGQAPEGTA